MAGIHLNMLSAMPVESSADPDEDERRALAARQAFSAQGSAYARLQTTKPQTIGYALANPPAGQAAWICEKLAAWSDCGGDPEAVLTRDEILDAISIYWLTNSAASSARVYYKSMASFRPKDVTFPVGFSAFPGEIIPTPRKLGGAGVSEPDPLAQPAEGWPFCGIRTTGFVRGGIARMLCKIALTHGAVEERTLVH